MKRQYNFLWGLLLLPFIATIISCTNERRALLEEEDQPITLQINYSATTEAEENPLRAAITPYEEYKVHNLFIFLVDGSGNIVKRQFFSYENLLNKQEHSSGTANNADTTKGSVNIKTTTGVKKVYAIANVINGIEALLDISKETLNNASIKTEADLNNLFATLKPNKETLSRINGRLLMSGISEKSLSSSDSSIDVMLVRVTAKVTFTIQAADGITFTPLTWQVYRVPNRVSVFPTEAEDGGVNGNDDFFNADTPRVFEGDAAGGEAANSFTYYQLENLKPAKGNPTSREDREKQEKTLQSNGKVKNGAWVNAPDNGTYVVLKGRYEKTEDDGKKTRADVQYTIHLGFVENDATDYNCRRNTHYNYTITVKGVEDIVLEAKATNHTDERDTGAEGKVTRGPKKYVFDSHFVQFVTKFHKSALNTAFLNSFDNGHFTPKKMYKVSTPYGPDDIGWVEFLRNDLSNKNQVALYPGRGDGSLQNVEQMFQDLYENQNNQSYFDSDEYVYYTVFVNEYYYEDKDFWTFVNQPDRTMILSIGGENFISYDTKSEYSDNQYGIWQKSIKTGYPKGSSDALGFETLDESYGTPYENDPTPPAFHPIGINNNVNPGKGKRPYGNSPDDGWYNSVTSWHLVIVPTYHNSDYEKFARTAGQWTDKGYKFRRWDNYVNLHEIVTSDEAVPSPNATAEGWGTYVLVKDGEDKKYKKGYEKYASYNRARYACLSRNRDLNGDGMIDKEEVRWYMPAENQLTGIWQVSGKINREDQMYSEPSYYTNLWKIRYVHYLSSTIAEQGRTGDWRNNVRVLWSEEGNSTSHLLESLDWTSVKGDYAQNNKRYFNRCVRTLNKSHIPYEKPGVLTEYDDKHRVISIKGNIDINNYRDVNVDYLTGEYPPHSERSPFNRPASSFQVAKDWIPKDNNGLDWKHRNDKERGCASYSEAPDGSDRGQWRVPNQRELLLIVKYNLVGKYDYKYLKDDVKVPPSILYQFYNVRVWSSTFFSNAPKVDSATDPRAFIGEDKGVALHRQRYRFPDGHSQNRPSFKLRCVRDYPY